MDYPDLTAKERAELRKQWDEALTAFHASLADLTDEELAEIERELIEDVDERVRQKAMRLERRAS